MRYLPHTREDIAAMLDAIGVSSIDELFDTIPEDLKFRQELNLPGPLSEIEINRHLDELEALDTAAHAVSFLGAGAYAHSVPAVVDAIVSRSEFSTAYTPYQPEVSQGTLQAVFEFQTMVAGLLGMDVANASMYDGASAAAEAVLMARRVRRDLRRVILSKGLLPDVITTIETYVSALDLEVVTAPLSSKGTIDIEDLSARLTKDSALVLQSPNMLGCIEDLSAVSDLVKDKGAFFITHTAEPYSLALLDPPGKFNAHVAVAEGQAFGNPVSFGGPFLGLFATKSNMVRQMPGRIVGMTKDVNGKTGYVLTLATREQHIRRARATSNICTNEGLCALAALVHLCLLGPEGLKKAALTSRNNAEKLKDAISQIPGYSLPYKDAVTFNEFVIQTPMDSEKLVRILGDQGILPGVPLSRLGRPEKDRLLVCTTEVHTGQDLDRLVHALESTGK